MDDGKRISRSAISFKPIRQCIPPNSAPAQPTDRLSDCVKNLLAKYGFDRSLLDNTVIHPNGLPSYVPKNGTGAYTEGRDIYFPKGQYDPYSVRGITNIGHEEVHRQQFEKYGKAGMGALYFGDSALKFAAGMGLGTPDPANIAYWANHFEGQAYKKEGEIFRDLDKRFQGRNPCAK